jgi:hypothetical protein
VKIIKLILILLNVPVLFAVQGGETRADCKIFHGASDASAAVSLSKDIFVVADDENNILRFYEKDGSSYPIGSFDLTGFLRVDSEHPEADIEGAAKAGDKIYWISSHGRNKDGKFRESRYRFFATKIEFENNRHTLKPEGKVCKNLLESMLQTPSLLKFNLDKAAGWNGKLDKDKIEKLAPKEQGLNIEALCSSPDGGTLYIGFRNPRPNNEALIVPLLNPAAVIQKQEKPVFGEPILWDLGGLGLRAMEYYPKEKVYLIVAGFYDGRDGGTLYRWTGKRADKPVFIKPILPEIKDFTPEAIVNFEDNDELWFLSDDGSLLVDIDSEAECMPGEAKNGKCQNKHLIDPARRTFRAAQIIP